MQHSKGNLFYNPQILQNIGEFIPLKDLLNTATLSKQHHQLLKQYLMDHYQLTNQQQKNEFQQLKELFNRKLFLYNKNADKIKQNPSNIILRNIQCHELYSVAQTLDLEYKLIKTNALLTGDIAQLESFPQRYRYIKVSETGMMYCCEGERISRFNLNNDPFANGESLNLKGQIEGVMCGFRYTIVVVRDQPDSVSFLLFDEKEPLASFKPIETPFSIPKFELEGNMVLGRGNSYFLFNQTLYEIYIKNCTVFPHPEFEGKFIKKIMGGKSHFIAFERTQQPSETWNTQQVIKFAQKEGFEDYIKILKTQKVTGKVLLEMDKKYMEEVLGIVNQKLQLKLKLRIEECNKENPDEYVVHGWGRAAEGQLSTNPSKQIGKPFKIKLPGDCKVFRTCGNFTFIENTKDNKILVNNVDEKTNKLEWKEMTNRKVWSISTVEDNIIVVASASKDSIPQRESEQPISQKKQKLRTAKNIIDKITWSQHLNKEQFKVGYLDKYEGILEVSFSELEQSEIKQYRIEYFKHNGKVMWDKKKRIDIL